MEKRLGNALERPLEVLAKIHGFHACTQSRASRYLWDGSCSVCTHLTHNHYQSHRKCLKIFKFDLMMATVLQSSARQLQLIVKSARNQSFLILCKRQCSTGLSLETLDTAHLEWRQLSLRSGQLSLGGTPARWGEFFPQPMVETLPNTCLWRKHLMGPLPIDGKRLSEGSNQVPTHGCTCQP